MAGGHILYKVNFRRQDLYEKMRGKAYEPDLISRKTRKENLRKTRKDMKK